MALEDLTGAGKYISNLVITNPLSADDRREGDDHIRGIKNVLKNSFPTLAGPVTFSDYVLKAGDSMTGALKIVTAIPSLSLIKSASGQPSAIYGDTGLQHRWAISLGDATAEAGSNAGSNFVISRWNDAGVFLDSPLTISRSNGQCVFPIAVNAVRGVSYDTSLGVYGITSSSYVVSAPYRFAYIWSGASVGEQAACQVYANPGVSIAIRHQVGVSGALFDFQHNGDAAKTGVNPSWIVISDASAKTDVEDYTRGLADLLHVQPKSFTFIPTQTHEHGVIAQDIQPYLPETVGTSQGPEKTHLTFNAWPLTLALINAVKELNARIEALEAAP